jgi:hypothetical protein
MSTVAMSKAYHQNIWVAAFLAVILKVLALPMSSALGTVNLEQLMLGSFCSSGGVQQVSLLLKKDESSSTAKVDQSHCCCSQSMGAVPIPTATFVLPVFLLQVDSLLSQVIFSNSPRWRWPSLNPRASPVQKPDHFFVSHSEHLKL